MVEAEKATTRQKKVLHSPRCKPERTLHAGKRYLWREGDKIGKEQGLESEARDLNLDFFFNKLFDFDLIFIISDPQLQQVQNGNRTILTALACCKNLIKFLHIEAAFIPAIHLTFIFV